MDLRAVGVPLRQFGLNKALDDVGAEGFGDDLILQKTGKRLVKASRQARNASLLALFGRHMVDVLRRGRRGRKTSLDAVESGRDDRSKGEIGVARWVGRAQFDAAAFTTGRGHPD